MKQIITTQEIEKKSLSSMPSEMLIVTYPEKVAWDNGFIKGAEWMQDELLPIFASFLDSIRDYERESGHSIADDERESKEFFEIWLKERESDNDSHE